MLGFGQHPALARGRVFAFEPTAPLDGRPGDPNLRLISHRARVLLRKGGFESKVRRHYTGKHIYKRKACAMIEGRKDCQLHT